MKPLEKVNIIPQDTPSVQSAMIVNADASAIMALITRAATDNTVDVEKLERLAGIYERITVRSAEQSFNQSLKAAQEEMPRILRDAVNDSTKSRYARLETISEKINPIIHKHGFSPSFGTADCPLANHYRVTCRLSHSAGFSRDYHADIPADVAGARGNANKTATHGFGATMSYGRRYLKLMIFDVVLTNEDDDGKTAAAAANSGFITEKQVEQLRDLIEDKGAPLKSFLSWAKVSRLDEIPADWFQSCVDAINQYQPG